MMQPATPPFLMIPGPTPLPDAVREALAQPAIGHRSADFKEVLKRVFPKLRWLFQCKNEVFLYTASGTGAMEAALVNTLNEGDRVLVLVNGVFSARWAEIAETLGLVVERFTVPAGGAHMPEQLKEYLEAAKVPFKAVLLTHSETSTGVLNPIQAMIPAIRAHGALAVVDAVTSLGAAEFRFDEWDIDLAVSGSQKGFMLPPGLSFLAYSDRAWAAHKQCRCPGYYFNFSKYLKSQQEFTTPYTPATPLIVALDIALEMLQVEGLEGAWQRHRDLRDQTRKGVQELGLELFVKDPAYASPAVTPFLPPTDVSVDDIRGTLRKTHHIVIADGQKELKGKICRIGHLGYISKQDVRHALESLQSTLQSLGYTAEGALR